MKAGKTARDIFAPTANPTALRASAVAAPSTSEPYTKATVVLRNSQIVFLDRIASDIRAKTGAAVARAELIRAMIDAISERGLDLSTAASEADVKMLLLKCIVTS